MRHVDLLYRLLADARPAALPRALAEQLVGCRAMSRPAVKAHLVHPGHTRPTIWFGRATRKVQFLTYRVGRLLTHPQKATSPRPCRAIPVNPQNVLRSSRQEQAGAATRAAATMPVTVPARRASSAGRRKRPASTDAARVRIEGVRGSIPSAPRKTASQRLDLRSCWLMRVRFARFWERRRPIFGSRS